MATQLEQNADRLKALGHPVRLAILRLVVQGHEEGTPAGEIQEKVGIPASTLSHHLACLAETGLVLVEREGTVLRYRAHFETLHKLTQYLWEDCCKAGRNCASAKLLGSACCTPTLIKPKKPVH
jgi:ArsR family transcriptional regulator, arsenate/arsenite/antimonite-responsive transcriptional repressor